MSTEAEETNRVDASGAVMGFALLVIGGVLSWLIFGVGGTWAHLAPGWLAGVATVVVFGWLA